MYGERVGTPQGDDPDARGLVRTSRAGCAGGPAGPLDPRQALVPFRAVEDHACGACLSTGFEPATSRL